MGSRADPPGAAERRERLIGARGSADSESSPLFEGGYPARDGRRTGWMPLFFELSSWALALVLFAIVIGATTVGLVLGRVKRDRSDHLHKPVGSLQTAVLGVVGLVLAFGLALAVGRYELRRAAVVEEANTIGTTYLRAQTLAEPQ